MAAADQIPASSLLGHALDDAILARETTIRVLRRQNAQLLAIVLVLLAIVAGFGATAFSLVVRNNLVILPDRSRKEAPAKPTASLNIFRRGGTADHRGSKRVSVQNPAGGRSEFIAAARRANFGGRA